MTDLGNHDSMDFEDQRNYVPLICVFCNEELPPRVHNALFRLALQEDWNALVYCESDACTSLAILAQ